MVEIYHHNLIHFSKQPITDDEIQISNLLVMLRSAYLYNNIKYLDDIFLDNASFVSVKGVVARKSDRIESKKKRGPPVRLKYLNVFIEMKDINRAYVFHTRYSLSQRSKESLIDRCFELVKYNNEWKIEKVISLKKDY